MSNLEIFFMVIAALLALVVAVDIALDLFDWMGRRWKRKDAHGK